MKMQLISESVTDLKKIIGRLCMKKTKLRGKILAILMSLAMVFTMMPMIGGAVYADDTTLLGDGTAANPYKISNYDDLKAFAEIVKSLII